MKLAFCIFKYFPYGGLQKDLYRCIEIALSHGHEIDLYTMHSEGPLPSGVNLILVPVWGWTNHSRALLFSFKLNLIFNRISYDKIIGFNKIPNLDIYFTGENCFAQNLKNRSFLIFSFFPRYIVFSYLEKKVFHEKSKTEILLISPNEKKIYKNFYHTKENQFHILPPGIEKRSFSSINEKEIKKEIRAKYNISEDMTWILFVASNYNLKGLDRLLKAIHILDHSLHKKVTLSIVGDDESKSYKLFIEKNELKTRIDFLGASNSVYELMTSADLLVHPAKLELAGKVLLEALINHLPILTTEVCGCAHYVLESQGGIVLDEPFSQDHFILALKKILNHEQLDIYKNNLNKYNISNDVYKTHNLILDKIESLPSKQYRNFYIHSNLIHHFPRDKKSCIDYVFQLEGKVYRHIKNRKTILSSIMGEDYFIKIHKGVGWYEIIKNLMAFKWIALGAKQEYKAICEMSRIGILTPKIYAYATDGINPAKINSFIITKSIEHQYILKKLCETWSNCPPSFLFKRRLIHRIAEITRKMHSAGINHRDYYLSHFLLNKRTEQDFDLYLIDLHRAQIRKKVPFRWLSKDLSALYAACKEITCLSNSDIYYFLKEYYQRPIRNIFKEKRLLFWWIKVRAALFYHKRED